MRRWLATLVTIPMAAIFLVLGLLSTGAGHGTVTVLKLYYAPIYLLRHINLSFIDGFAFGVALFCGLHIAYSLLADYLRRIPRGAIYFGVLLCVHYGLFVYAIDEEDRSKFNRAYSLDPSFINFAIALFLCWQVFLLFLILKKSRSLVLNSIV